MTENKQRQKGVQVAVSPEAHELMRNAAYKAKPRRTLREHINIMNKLSKDL